MPRTKKLNQHSKTMTKKKGINNKVFFEKLGDKSKVIKNMIDDVSEHNFLQYYHSLFLCQHCLSHTLYGLRFVLIFMSGLFNVSSKYFPNNRIKMKMKPKKFLFQM